MKYATIPEFLLNAAAHGEGRGTGYVRFDGSVFYQTYAETFETGRKLLDGLHRQGMAQGDKVILSFDKNEEIVPMLWACFLGGIIPTVLQPPVSFTEHNPAADKIVRVYEVFGKPKVIFSDTLHDKWCFEGLESSRMLKYSSIVSAHPCEEPAIVNPEDLAFVQFSSGSTGDPKGIMLTHRNLMTNLADITTGIDIHPEDRAVNWMPLYHDMGLVGFLLTPWVNVVTHFLIEIIDFIKKPTLWLDIMSREKITITASPNFGLALVLRHLERKKYGEWDFSHCKVMMNGAETISIPIMNDFIRELQPFGFKPQAMYPCYGMAEATLACTFATLHEGTVVSAFNRTVLITENKAIPAIAGDDNSMELVSVGKSLPNVRLRIVDEDDSVVPERQVGHIQISGENVTQGYYENPAFSSELFCGEWLRTGDLGFFYNGELYISGRHKDVIFINSRNYYASDLESMVMQIEGISYGKVAMGGVFDETLSHDKLVLFIVGANNEQMKETCLKIRSMFNRKLGIGIDVFVPLKSNEMPRTSSGKIQRYKLISRYVKGEFPVVVD